MSKRAVRGDSKVVRLGVLATLVAAWLAAAGTASAAQLVARNATGVRIVASSGGEAMLKVDYSGGWHTHRTLYWRHFPGGCGRYDGPLLPNVVAACKAPDGSYWAAQSWPQPLPNLGFTPWLPELRASWLEISHWTGPVAELEAGMDWVYGGRFQDLFGRYTYRGTPVYG